MMEELVMRYRYRDLLTEKGVELYLEQWAEVKRTPCGAWVKPFYDGKISQYSKKRFVRDGDGRRLCHQTKAMAWDAHKDRKKNQKRMAEDSIAKATYALEQIEAIGAAPESTMILGKPGYWYNYAFD